jgi:hypothetical protein
MKYTKLAVLAALFGATKAQLEPFEIKPADAGGNSAYMWAQDDYIYTRAQVNHGNYFGLGFGSQMDGSDMVVFFGMEGTKEAYAADYKAPGYKSVSYDSQQDWESFGSNECNDSYCDVTVRRKMDTGDRDDY